MAQRRQFTGYGNDNTQQGQVSSMPSYTDSDPNAEISNSLMESKDTLRRRVTPVIGSPEPRPSTLQEILAMLNGSA